jgi:hypothetical protein
MAQRVHDNAMDFSMIRGSWPASGLTSSSGLVVAERYGYGRGPGVAPGHDVTLRY